MSVLTSASTDVQVWAEYDNNASYVEDNSVAKARAFITAVLILLRRTPSGMLKGSNSLNFNVEVLQRQLDEARRWLEGRDSDALPGPSVTRPDFRRFRG
jgi:hypothetical protein